MKLYDVPVKLKISSNVGDGGEVESLVESPRHPNLTVSDGYHPSPSYLIAQQLSALISSEACFSFLEQFISRRLEISFNVGDGGDVESLAESPISSTKGRHWFPCFQEPFFTTSQVGRHEVVEEILVACPDLIYSLDEEGHTALGIAVMNHDIDIYNLTSRMRYVSRQFLSTQMDHGDNTLLHLVGALPPKHKVNLVSGGAAIQMQNELICLTISVQKDLTSSSVDDTCISFVGSRINVLICGEAAFWNPIVT
ncbi:hypothetical protein RHSIM_Rhsim07G0100100 [Rhododendron simsii]|uniref:Uncharacterized protein n=1 Tax=Rhododendron simsii TaxID=118357 RepID=A0A834GQG2_RHOSS|nr:hypothetical protein RHSIM_Rhsim07G0100100 [Rhododendron simsii]